MKKVVTAFKNAKAEIKKLIKPSKKDLLKYTWTVCIFCFFSASIIWLMDTFIRFVMQLILK